MKRKVVVLALAVSFGILALWGWFYFADWKSGEDESLRPLDISMDVPHFTIYDLENQPVQFSDFSGKLLLINFWASWCPPCVEEIPHLQKLYENFSKKGLVVLGVSLDDSKEKVRSFINKNKVSYPLAMANDKILKDFGGIRGIPTSFLVDRNGKIVRKWGGYRDYKFFESLLKEFL